MDDSNDTPIALRKQLLITQGAMYRSGLAVSKQKVVNGLQAESLARSMLKQLGLAALTAWRTRSGIAATGMPALLPVVLSGLSKAWRQQSWKPIVRGVLIAGAVASAVALFVRYKGKSVAREEAEDEDDF